MKLTLEAWKAKAMATTDSGRFIEATYHHLDQTEVVSEGVREAFVGRVGARATFLLEGPNPDEPGKEWYCATAYWISEDDWLYTTREDRWISAKLTEDTEVMGHG